MAHQHQPCPCSLGRQGGAQGIVREMAGAIEGFDLHSQPAIGARAQVQHREGGVVDAQAPKTSAIETQQA